MKRSPAMLAAALQGLMTRYTIANPSDHAGPEMAAAAAALAAHAAELDPQAGLDAAMQAWEARSGRTWSGEPLPAGPSTVAADPPELGAVSKAELVHALRELLQCDALEMYRRDDNNEWDADEIKPARAVLGAIEAERQRLSAAPGSGHDDDVSLEDEQGMKP